MYKVLDIDTAEADDIIGTLVQQYHNVEKILIISSDKDFLQLQKYSNVYQYSIKNKTLIEDNNPARGLKEKIIRGDRNDGIPNILSADDVFVTNTRQKSIISDKLEQWLNQSPEKFCNEEMLRNYSRNNVLINLDCIPDSLKNIILYKYIETKHQTRQKFLSYLIENRMSEFISDISDF
jgi:5'-3' exonuclease